MTQLEMRNAPVSVYFPTSGTNTVLSNGRQLRGPFKNGFLAWQAGKLGWPRRECCLVGSREI